MLIDGIKVNLCIWMSYVLRVSLCTVLPINLFENFEIVHANPLTAIHYVRKFVSDCFRGVKLLSVGCFLG